MQALIDSFTVNQELYNLLLVLLISIPLCVLINIFIEIILPLIMEARAMEKGKKNFKTRYGCNDCPYWDEESMCTNGRCYKEESVM